MLLQKGEFYFISKNINSRRFFKIHYIPFLWAQMQKAASTDLVNVGGIAKLPWSDLSDLTSV